MAEVLACDEPVTANNIEAFEKLVTELSEFVVFLVDPKACIITWNRGSLVHVHRNTYSVHSRLIGERVLPTWIAGSERRADRFIATFIR